MKEVFLVTGAFGCIGAWVLRNLVREGVQAVAMDLATEPTRPRLLMTPEELSRVTFVQADVTDLKAIQAVVAAHGITHIIHLAALQTPGCKANPSLGARVNVGGTVNILEAVRQSRGQVRGLAYASSVAVLGRENFYAPSQLPLRDDAPLHPETLYGVWKQANEHTARLYWQDWGIGSVALRPFIVYGVARDQGLTSDIAKAILAAAAGRAFRIQFGKKVALQYTDDVARMFIRAARTEYQGAAACNLCNDVIEVGDFVAMLKAQVSDARISYDTEQRLPFPADLDDSGLRRILGEVPHTPLPQAIRESLVMFRELLAQRRIDPDRILG